jgi:taurine dioxygenase
MVIRHIAGLSDEESSALLSNLHVHATRARYLHTHRWSQGDLVIWDNLATVHTASPCDSSRYHRLLYRASVH